MVWVKTQFAGIEIHKLIIHLFKYLSNKYFTDFEVIDEGKYWETGDEEKLQEMFHLYNDLLDSFSSALKIYPIEKGETFEAYFGRMMERVQERRRKR